MILYFDKFINSIASFVGIEYSNSYFISLLREDFNVMYPFLLSMHSCYTVYRRSYSGISCWILIIVPMWLPRKWTNSLYLSTYPSSISTCM